MFALAVLALFAVKTTSEGTNASQRTSHTPHSPKAEGKSGQKPRPDEQLEHKSHQPGRQKQQPTPVGRMALKPPRLLHSHAKPLPKPGNKAPVFPEEDQLWPGESKRLLFRVLGLCFLMSIGAGGITFLVKYLSGRQLAKNDEVPLAAEHRNE
jgi:hypothetical protein